MGTRGAVTLSDLLAGLEANSAKGNNQSEKLSNFKESYATHRQEVINNVENREAATSPLPVAEQNNVIQNPAPDASTEEKPEAKKEPSYVTNNILFEQWKEGFDKRREEKNAEKNAEEHDKLQKQLKELNQNAAYISTTAASDEYEQERKSLLEQLHALDEAAGRENRSYDGRERAGAFFGSWGKGTGASYINAVANLIDVGNEVGANAKNAERELADLEAQLAKAQTAYQETVREYGEAGAAFEKNLLADAQQKYDAKKALYASTEDRDRAAYEKTKATAANMYDVADKLLTQSEQDMQKAKYGTSAVGSFALDAAKTGLDIAADTALSAVGVPGLASMAARVYGSETQQARLQGDDAQTAAAKGLKSALIEVAAEKIAGPFEKAYGKTALSSSIDKAVDKLNASGLLKWAADTAGEGFEEGMSDVLNTVADHIMGWDSGENSVWGDIAANKDEIVYDMLLGAFVGAFGATGNAVGNKANNTSPAAQAQPQVQPTEQSAPVEQTQPAVSDEARAEARREVADILSNGRINNSTANEIVFSPTLADAFYEVTGIALEGSTAAKRQTIKSAGREYAYSMSKLPQIQAEASNALTEHSRAEGERQSDLEIAANAPYDSYIRGIIEHGGNYSEAGEIARNPQLRAIWERMTGATLPNTTTKAREMIMNTRMKVPTSQMWQPAQVEAQTSPVAATQPTGDISTPPAAQNVKQGTSDALNSAVNYNSRETQTAAPTLAQQNTALTLETEKKPLSMADYVDKNSSIWNNLDYNDTAAQTKAMREAHERMTAEGRVVKIPESTQKKTAESFPDLRGMKKSERTPILKQKMAELKSDIRQFLNGLKGGSFEFEVNGNVLEAKLYDTGIKEVLEKITQDKANMLNHSDLIFDNAEYLYSLPDYDGNPNVYRWNYFYTPVQIGDSTAGVRIALRDMKQTDSGKTESQIYNWGIKKTPALDGGSPEKTSLSTGVSSAGVIDTTSERYAAEKDGFSQADVMSVSDDISSDTSISPAAQNVKQNFEGENYRSNLGKGNGTRTTQTVETINDAAITTDERREQINPHVKNGRFDYIPDTNKAQTERAVRAITRNGWSESAKDFHDAVIKGKSGKDLVAQGAVLLNNASNSNASAGEYLDLASDYIELLHRAGETLQAGKILQQLTPEGRLYCMQKTVKQINNSLTKGQHKAIAKAQEGKNYKNANIKETYMDYGVKLDENLADEYMKAETDEQRDAVISQIQQNIADQIPSTFVDKWNALRYVNMLGNFKTQVRNVGGNALMLAASTSKNRVKAAAEATANLFRDEDNQIERTASFIVGGKLRKEAAADFENIKDIARGEGKYNDAQRFGKEIQDKRTIFKVNGEWGKNSDSNFAGLRKAADVSMKVLEGYRNLTNKAMDVGDVVFLKATYADALGGWLKAHGIKSIADATPEQLERGRTYAIKEAQEATFRDDNVVSQAVSKIGKNPITEGIMPFRKTPANVAVRALEYSPVGVAETIYKAFQTKSGNANANDVINSLSKNIVGSTLAAAGYFLAKAGIARGSEDDDDLDQFQKMQGKQDYAVKIGDEWISLSQLAPNSVPLYMGVKLYELLDGGSLTFEDMSQILGVLSDPLMDMSMLSGINDALADVVTYGNDSDLIWKVLENAALSYLTQGINNSIIGQIEQASEENRQTVYSDKDSPLSSNAQYKLGKALGKIPGVDYHQQDYIDAWGRTQSNGSAGERAFDAFLNPVYTSKDSTTKVDSELERLYKAGKNVEGFPNVLPSKASRSTEYVKGQTLTPDEYKQYSIDRGQKSLELVSGFMESKEYKQLSDQQRAEVISDLYSLAATQAMNKVKSANGVAQADLSKYKGISDKEIPQYLATKQVLSDAKNSKTTDWSGVDALLANIKSYSPEVQAALQDSDNGLNVKKLLYADNLDINSQEWYKVHNAAKENKETTGSSKDWVTAEAIGKLGGSNEDKLARLSAEMTPASYSYNLGGYRRQGVLKRYDAAINSGVDFDTWTDVEKVVEQLRNGDSVGWQCSKKFIKQALADNGYTQREIDDVWAIKTSAGDDEEIDQIDDYWGQLIDNAGKAAAEK